MNKCAITPQDLKKIKSKVGAIVMNYRRNKETVDSLENSIINVLTDLGNQYEIEGAAQIVEAVRGAAKSVTDQSSQFFSFTNLINVFTRANQGLQTTSNHTVDANNLTDTKQVMARLDATREFLDNAYGFAHEVRNYVQNKTNQNIYDACFINRGSIDNIPIGIVRSNTELNSNIREYQEQLLRQITDYIKYVTKNIKLDPKVSDALNNPKLYKQVNGQFENTGILEILNPVISFYLSNNQVNLSDTTLRKLYQDMNNLALSQQDRENAKRRLDAYNANIILTHFDSYLSLQLGKAIDIIDFGRKTGKDKYRIAQKTANVYSTWRISDDINVEDEADTVTKLAISTTPLYTWGSDTPKNGRFLYFQDFSHIIAKIKDLSYRTDVINVVFNDDFKFAHSNIWNSLSKETQNYLKDKTLSQAINYIRRNPRYYFPRIFELLTNKNFYEFSKYSFMKTFTSDELNKLYSLGKGIFNPSNSLYSLTRGKFDTDYFGFITQTADSIFNVQFVQYYRDNEGNIQVITLINQSVNNIRRGIEQTINSSNSIRLMQNFDNWKAYLNLKQNDGSTIQSIKFTVPNTNVEINVSAASGTVTITNNNSPIKDYSEIWDQVSPFIENILRVKISENADLQSELEDKLKSKSGMCQSLLSFASRIIMNQYVSYTTKDIPITEIEDTVNKIFGTGKVRYNYSLAELDLVHATDIPTLKVLALAQANVSGVTTATTVKDGEGNSQSLQSLSRLLGSLQSQKDLQELAENSATNECMLLTVPGLYEGVYTAKEFHDDFGTNKAFTEMSVGEMSYSGIMLDFFKGLIPANEDAIVGNGHVMFLPSVNSDKPTIGRIRINLNKTVTINGQQKAIKDLNSTELQQLIADEIGTIYIKAFENVIQDLKKLDDFANLPIKLSASYIYGFKQFNDWWLNEGSHIEIDSNGNEIRVGNTYQESSPVDLVKRLVLNYNETNRLHPLELIDQVHYKNNKGLLTANRVFIAQIARFKPKYLRDLDQIYPVDAFVNQNKFWTAKKAEVLKSLIKAKFSINTTRTQQVELLEFRRKYPEWIDCSGNIILAKVNINGEPKTITSEKDLLLLGSNLKTNDLIDSLSDKLILNPVIEQYNYLSYLFTQEFMCSTVGSFIAHPEKSKSNDVLKQEAAHFQAQHKRNVSFTAAMHAFQLNLLNGIPDTYNIAVIDDIKDTQGTIQGLLNSDIKPFDGATFVNPFIVLLENYSLGGAKAGVTKKQFVHFKNERTGTGGIIKTAGFGLTNDWIRNSPFLQRMMRKMTDHVWLEENGDKATVDITTAYDGSKINYPTTYYKTKDGIFKIVKIKKLAEANKYVKVLQQVNLDGSLIGEEFEQEAEIDTNYKLWEFFGGANSMEFKGDSLILTPSNSSVERVVQAMNSIGTPRVSGEIETQEQLWQPLKRVDVHYVVTAGAIKQGAANTNPNSTYYDEDSKYSIQQIKMYQSGIQLDKEHHADESELSLMTQVISACASQGYTFEVAAKLYDALRRMTDISLAPQLKAIEQLLNINVSTNIQEVLIKSIVKVFSTSNGTNFVQQIAKDIMKRAKEGEEIKYSKLLIPLSDNTVYAKIFSTVSSFLTNAGIKQKIPGILSVLTPSHSIFKLWAGRKYESFTDPENELAELQKQQLPVFDINDPTSNISNLELGREYFITEDVLTLIEDENGNPVEVPVPVTNSIMIKTPIDYQNLKKKILEGKVSRVVENVTVGRDLAAYNVRFRSSDGRLFQLWDLNSATALFKVKEILNSDKNDLNKAEEIADLMKEYYDVDFKEQYGVNWVNFLLPRIENLLRYHLQIDLRNLSPSQTTISQQFEELLEGNDGSVEWCNQFIQRLNLLINRHNGSNLIINGEKVTNENFDRLLPDIRTYVDKFDSVRIGKEFVKIDKSSIKVSPYEIIMSKTFATRFGLDEFADLNKIANNPNYFIEQYLKNQTTQVESNQYDVELKVSTGKHYYLLSRKNALQSGLTKAEVRTAIIDDILYRVDEKDDIMYEMLPNTEIWVDGKGKEVIVTDSIPEYINNLSFDSIKLSNRLITRPKFVLNLIKQLSKSKKPVVKRFYRYVTAYQEHSVNKVADILGLNEELHSINLKNWSTLPETDPIIVSGREKHTAFLKSLDVIAARIPAQSMQSFMPMRVVAYDNPDVNTAYVSTLQILLQGSDYDIDSGSIATFDIDYNGKLQLWSPYANCLTLANAEASMQLPIPTGTVVKTEEVASLQSFGMLLQKYMPILQITKVGTPDGLSDSEIAIRVLNDTPEKLQLLKELLSIKNLQIPNAGMYKGLARALNDLGITENITEKHIPSLIKEFINIINSHNSYLDNLSTFNLHTVMNNYQMSALFATGIDPVNLLEAQTPIDSTTGPLKEYANNNSDEAKEASLRTPGNAINLYEGIVENQVGKKGISICATGLKSFFGLTQYYNSLLNDPNADQSKIILDHGGILIGNKVYHTLANIRALHPKTIIDSKILEILSNRIEDKDVALTLSALLSLATDNAKELALSKLNAGTKTLGMYIYGLSIGMEFNDIASIMMSDVGRVINDIMQQDVFSNKDGFSRVSEKVFDYFEYGPNNLLQKYQLHQDSNGETIGISPLDFFTNKFNELTDFVDNRTGRKKTFSEALASYALSNVTVQEKLKFIESFRNIYTSSSQEAKEIYNGLIDFIEQYIVQGSIIGQNLDTYNSIKTLSEGAEEMRLLGQLFGLNQGLKGTSDKLVQQISNIEKAIYARSNNSEDIFDLTQFAFNDEYRELQISKYEKVKHSFNVLDAISRNPHTMGYVRALAIAKEQNKQSFKFRSILSLVNPARLELQYNKEDNIIKGLQNYIGDYLVKQWMLSRDDTTIVIPKGNMAYDKSGNIYELTEDTPIKLGTDWGNATFRKWFENQVIPDLKAGRISPGVLFGGVSGNKFIKDLGNDLLTTTVSHNPTVVYTLPINMLPRTDTERAIFNDYKNHFNMLAKDFYEYDTNSYQIVNDSVETITSRQQIPIVDLFIYYAMIADNWKLGEKSLVPIFEDLHTLDTLKDFHDFVAQLDKSGEVLSINNMPDILPYIAPFENPYTSYANRIWYKNRVTKKYEQMVKNSNTDYILEPENRDSIGNYNFVSTSTDSNYFLTNSVEGDVIYHTFKLDDNISATIGFNKETDKLFSISLDSIHLDSKTTLELFQKISPISKIDGHKVIRKDLISAVLNYQIKQEHLLDTSSLGYQALRQKVDTPDLLLEALCEDYLTKYNRLPYLDEIPNSNSEPALRSIFNIKSNNLVNIKEILETTSTSTIEEATAKINDEYRDLEVKIIPIDEDALVQITHKPKDNNFETNNIDQKNFLENYVVFTNALNKLAQLYGIKFNSITDAELASDQWQGLIPEASAVNAFIYNGQIYINTDRNSIDAPIHEMLHLFVGSMRFTNPKVYQNLIDSVTKIPRYNILLSQYKNRTRNDANEEIFVTELAKFLVGLDSELTNLTSADIHSISYNVNRMLDIMLLGQDSASTIPSNEVFNLSLKSIAKQINSSALLNNFSGTFNAEGSELHRKLNNIKADLYKEGTLEEHCE